MKKFIGFFIVFSFIYSCLHGLTYDSGSYGISSTDDITISTITASSATFTAANIGTLTTTNTTTSTGTFTYIGVTTITASGAIIIPFNAAPRTNVVPLSIGQLIRNTTPDPDEICFSTGTTLTTWVLIRSSNTACSN